MEVVGGKSINEVIPRELFYKIFSMMPITSLLQLRSVCKEWRSIIDEPFFQNVHLTEDPLILIHWHSPEHGKSRLHLIKEDYSRSSEVNSELQDMGWCILENSCKSLLYFVFENSCRQEQLLVCHPLTGHKLILPVFTSTEHEIRFHVYAFGFDCSVKMFKIVRLRFPSVDENGVQHEAGAQVCTLGETTNSPSWREITQIRSSLFHKDNYSHGRSVYASGAAHWLVFYKKREHCKYWEREILSFNFTTEKFNIIPHPEASRVARRLSKLVELRGYLGVVYYLSPPTHIDIWKLKDYEKKIWVQERRFDMSPLLETRRMIIEVVGETKNGEILVQQSDMLFSHNQETNNPKPIYTLTRDTDMDLSYEPMVHICSPTLTPMHI